MMILMYIFNKMAVADTEFSVSLVEKTLKQFAEKESRFILFCDNLTTQVMISKRFVTNLGGIVCFGVLNSTDM